MGFFRYIVMLLALPCFILTAGQVTYAHAESPLPDKIQGAWALPDEATRAPNSVKFPA